MLHVRGRSVGHLDMIFVDNFLRGCPVGKWCSNNLKNCFPTLVFTFTENGGFHHITSLLPLLFLRLFVVFCGLNFSLYVYSDFFKDSWNTGATMLNCLSSDDRFDSLLFTASGIFLIMEGG